jgi:SAM-dependent methyltransferase
LSGGSRWEDADVVGGFATAAANQDASVDLVVAHGIWNLARSAAEFRRAIAEAARVARPGAGLFLFTFSRATLAADDEPIPGETFVFTQFAGEPQCFLTEIQLNEELRQGGFEKDPPGPLTEHNRPRAGRTLTRNGPVIYEGTFRRRGPVWRHPGEGGQELVLEPGRLYSADGSESFNPTNPYAEPFQMLIHLVKR